MTGGPRHQDAGDFFGGDVDISGNTIVVASPFFTLPEGPPSGSVVVFTNTGGSWVQSAVLRYPLNDEEPPGRGTHVAVEGDRLIVTSAFQGEAYFYRSTNGVWYFASVHTPTTMFTGSENIPAAISDEE